MPTNLRLPPPGPTPSAPHNPAHRTLAPALPPTPAPPRAPAPPLARALALALALSLSISLTSLSCATPVPADLDHHHPADASPASSPQLSVAPALAVGQSPRVAVYSVAFANPLTDDERRTTHAALLIGLGTATELIALGKGKPSAALKSRTVEMQTRWSADGTTLVAMPSAALDTGQVTLVVGVGSAQPFVAPLDVVDGSPIARLVFPLTPRRPGDATPWTYCLEPDAAFPVSSIGGTVQDFSGQTSLRIAATPSTRCIDLVPDAPLSAGAFSPPAAIGDPLVLLDPTPISVADDAPSNVSASCAADELSVPPICVRVDDDRVVLAAGATPAWVFGKVGDSTVTEALVVGARRVLHGLRPATSLRIVLDARGADAPSELRWSGSSRPRRRHLVVSEALARAPSHLGTQRFVELVNDSDAPVSLAGTSMLDGWSPISLPNLTLAPHAYALVVPRDYVAGLGGDVAPPEDVPIIPVETLHLTKFVALVDVDGSVISRLPMIASSKKTASRGRRTDDAPDDAADAFGWDENDSATPGRPNRIAAP